MGYCFMRFNKIKSVGQMKACYEHNYRIGGIDNTIPELEIMNEELVKLNGKTYEEVFLERTSALGYGIEKEYRKNGVLALEVVTSFSREDKERINLEEWKVDNIKWLERAFNKAPDKYGNNVLSVVYHADEIGNVHCHAFVVPIDEKGNLNASEFIGGKTKCVELQDSYARSMERHGLKRGIEGSVATHTEIQKFYGELRRKMDISIPEYADKDTPETYRVKIEDFIKSLQAIHYRELKEKDREIEIAKSLPQRDYKEIEHKYKMAVIERDKLKKERDELERDFGPMPEIIKKLKTVENLNDGIKNHPDVEFANRVSREMNEIVMAERSRKKKEKEKDKKRSKTIFDKEKGRKR